MHSYGNGVDAGRNGNADCGWRFLKHMAIGIRHGMAVFALASALLIVAAAMAGAQTYSVLYSFAGGADGAYPQAPVTLDTVEGSLYGVTAGGGSGGCQYPGCGTVFELTSSGVENVLHSFAGLDGVGPIDVMLDSAGNLFGTTGGGGAHGYGTVFKINPKGAEKVVYSFKGGADGDYPSSGLIQDSNTDDFYGVTQEGGTYGVGTLYKITASGEETVLHNFGNGGDQPAGPLVQDQNTRNIYGLLDFGGAWGCGGVFQFTPAGVEAAVYLFTGQRGDGCQPGFGDGLVIDAQGNLFGTTFFGGSANQGVVFELTVDGLEKVIYKFKGAKKGDGAWPYGGLVLDESTGNLYGTTEIGGTGQCVSGKVRGCGTIFELSPPTTKHGRWRETVLYSFTGGADGYYPSAGLARDTQTNLYGTAPGGGTHGYGVVFELTP